MHRINLQTDDEEELDLDLNKQEDWDTLVNGLQNSAKQADTLG